ncbi:MAG: EAL domain-containing protein [Alphaproteobacteria bacterium]|nr:EAL domain-containing protein [Alphaproteobacteria bacterium]
MEYCVLSQILESNQSSVISVDSFGNILFANTACLKMFGYADGELYNKPLKTLFPSITSDKGNWGGVVKLLDQMEIANTIEITGIRKDDSEFSVEVILTKTEKNFLCQVRDISRRQASESLDAILHTVLRRVMRGQSDSQFASFICEKLVSLFDFPLVWLGKKLSTGLVEVQSAKGLLSKNFPSHDIHWDDLTEKFGPTGQAIRSRKTVVVALDDDKVIDDDGREHIRQIIVFPLITHDGVEGVLEIHSKLGRLDDMMIQRMETFALRIAMAVQMSHDQQNLRLQRTALETSHNAFAITDQSGIVLWVNPAFCELSGYDSDELIGYSLNFLHYENQDDAFYKNMWDCLNAGKTWKNEIIERKKTGALYSVEQCITPILNSNKKLMNCIFVREDVTERKNAEGIILKLANYDQLTGLPNRNLFYEKLQSVLTRAKNNEKKVAVLFADLTNFNRINDTLGHSAGDTLLKIVGDRLIKIFSDQDFVARIGGDEFAVIVSNVKNAEAAASFARLMIESTLAPIQIENTEVNVGACVGISIFPDDGDDADKMVNYADMALRTASHSSPNSYFFFSQEMNEETEDHLALERDLRKAILQNEFVLYFQPQYDVKTKKILSAEALIRWMHPTRGMVSPMKFIPIAEDTGLIIPLGDWILKEALRHVKIWEEMGLPKISVAVNLSAVQFQQEDLVGVVEKALDESGVGTDQLELELTESVVMQDARKADNILSRLSKLGIKLAIDDFGTGYSSLSYLKKFKVNRLKIDQSFVRDMTNNYDDAEIAHAIINLGHTLGLEIVSEGVETKEQLELLQKQGCDVIQGYFISKPISASEIPAFLKKDSYYD